MERKYYKNEEELNKITRNDPEWYLYHHIKNEDALIPVIVFSCLSLFINGGTILFFCIWGWYFSYCNKNNRALDNDPYIRKKRESYKRIRREMLLKK